MNDSRQRIRRRAERGGAFGFLLLLLIAGGAAGAYWWKTRQVEPVSIDEDRVVEVQRRDLIKAVLATGRVEPLARVSIMSRASGILNELYVDDGDRVTPGQVLADLDREQLEAQHRENVGAKSAATARLKAAEARLAEARVRVGDPELEFAKREEARLKDLHESGSASLNELDDAELAVAVVEYRIRQIEASIPVLDAEVAQAEAGIESADAAVERTATALREATIRSPIEGIVLKREKEVGDGISSILTAGGNATPLMTLGDLSAMFVEAQVDEVDVGKVYVGMTALIEVDAYRGQPFMGKIQRIAPGGTVDNNGIVTFEVRISVEDPEQRLRVDMTANTRLVLEDRPSTLALPHKALQRDRTGQWIAQRVVRGIEPSIEPITVQIGVTDGLMTEILDGLTEGDEIVLPAERARAYG